MPFDFFNTEIKDVILIKPKVFKDSRGIFLETYKRSAFQKNGITENFIQDNISVSRKNVLRGLHFQKEPYSQAKIVGAIRGKILDVAVDLRKDSPTFGKYTSRILSEDNRSLLYIPKNFAHGFLTLSENATVLYKTSDEFAPEHDAGIIWNDKTINIDWGISSKKIILSEKDKRLPTLKEITNRN